MSRPKLKDKERWTSKRYSIGYLEPRNGIAQIRINGTRESTHLTWTDDNKKAAIKLLEERLKVYLHPELIEATTDNARIITLFEAILEFKNARYQDFGSQVKLSYSNAFKFYLDKDQYLEYESILKTLVQKNSAAKIKVSTRNNYLTHLRVFFAFCVDRGYLDKNPIDVIGIPKVPRKTDPVIFERDELEKIFSYYNGMPGKMREYGLLFKFLSLTGLRIGEAIKLKWSDIEPRGFRIHGKGSRIRHFPLFSPEGKELFPEVTEILNELRNSYTREKVFRWEGIISPSHQLNIALAKLNIPKTVNGLERTVHTFRSTAEHYWENTLHLPFDVICDLAGHSMAVRETHYRRQRQMKELGAAISYHIPEDTGQNMDKTQRENIKINGNK